MQADILRKKFLDFFKEKKHKVLPSDSLAPADDPTVLFTPAGMNQFKKEFLGFDSGFKRAATSQRCLRTDDLDKVGKTTGHHTFFEMLGNFSFGDYFKKEAIAFAWEFLTEELKIKKEKLWVSVYKEDDDAYKIWKDLIKVPQERIVRLGDKENFWPSEAKEKGPNGPCGPCSEIFFDPEGKVNSKNSLEVWNLVFTQYNRKEGGRLEPLPNKNIDTGMGLERLAAVMQGVKNNFETDLFQPLIKEILNSQLPTPNSELIYAIADHIRAVTFCIYDGVLPSNEARGYIVRKLIRKSTLHLRALGFTHPFLYKLVPVVAEIMQEPYPELIQRKEDIAQIVLSEEKNFIATLNSSSTLLEEKFSHKTDVQEAGKIAFQLYDTYGIPLELTEAWLNKQGIEFSQAAFDQELKEQKTRSKSQSAMKGDVFSSAVIDYGVKATKFLGYKDCSAKAKVLKIIKDGAEVEKISAGEAASIILDQTTFYAESGGQVGDSGELVKGKNIFEVLETKKAGEVFLHTGKVKYGSFETGDLILANVDSKRRLSIARNHTATHLLQAALRKVLGQHVQQQGSLVAEERLRFDFTHFQGLKEEELERVEEFVNAEVIADHKVEVKEKTIDEAKKTGALAFFGEKYGGRVRVVSIEDASKELCGGTHLDHTGKIGLFRILQEGSVASGVRRIEAVTGTFAYQKVKEEEEIIREVARLLGVPKEKIAQELEKKSRKIRELEKQLEAQKIRLVQNASSRMNEEAEMIKGIRLVVKKIENVDMDMLRKNVDLIKEKSDNTLVVLGSDHQGRALLVVGVTPDLCAKGLDAGKIIRSISGFIGGSGGGRNDFAQAGGNKPENLTQAFSELKKIIESLP